MSEHHKYMEQVLQLAKFAHIQTRPNPQVAAIIVKDNSIVGIGSHLRSGEPHAEIFALNQAGKDAIGATLYVNLEPCAHFGKTPPCADAVIKSGISTVVIANNDPNPLVAGNGIKKLRDAGIEVICDVMSKEAAEINKIFFHNIQTKKPYITIKAGLSLDGRIATKSNNSQWITGLEARKDAHQYRVSHEAILVGVKTVITDNPSLTAHLITNPSRNPIRIILDSNLSTPIDSKVVQDKLAPTWIVTCNTDIARHSVYIKSGCTVLTATSMNINEILDTIYKLGVYSLLVEGGEQIYSSFLDAKCVNQLVTYFSPQLIGSTDAKHLFAGNGFDELQTNLKFKFIHLEKLGNDIKIVSEVVK